MPVAQLVEQQSPKLKVGGSSPSGHVGENMFAFIGDIHGDFAFFHRKPFTDISKNVQVIQVGDFGIGPKLVSYWKPASWLNNPVFFIDGNHEFFPLINGYTKPTAIADGLVYLPRGTVLNMDGIRVGFCGGGFSVDKICRTPGYDWFPEERITTQDFEKFKDVGKLDLLVTHVPPAYFIRDNPDIGDLNILQMYWYKKGFIDANSYLVEDIWNLVGNPPLICGHMHKSKSDGRVRVLREEEVFLYDPTKMEL